MGGEMATAQTIVAGLRADVHDSELQRELDGLSEMLHAAPRLAVLGPVSAGKSTLVNAILATRVAPVKAGECTRVVTVYRHGPRQLLTIHYQDGHAEHRSIDGPLPDDLGVPIDHVTHLEVTLSNERLRRWTIIDTPGLDTVTATPGARSTAPSVVRHGAADCYVYLLPRPRGTDRAALSELNGFDRSLGAPVVAVLSRVDELTDGSNDVAVTGRRLAEAAASALELPEVVPIVGLWAETAAAGVMTGADGSRLRSLVSRPASDLEGALRTYLDLMDLAEEERIEGVERLVALFGMVGLRLLAAQGTWSPAEVSDRLFPESNYQELEKKLHGLATDASLHKVAMAAAHLEDLAARWPSWRGRLMEAHHTLDVSLSAGARRTAVFDRAHRLVATRAVRLGDELLTQLRQGRTASNERQLLGLPDDAPDRDVRHEAMRRAALWQSTINHLLAPIKVKDDLHAVKRIFDQVAFAASPERS